jgi:hypothetical protein
MNLIRNVKKEISVCMSMSSKNQSNHHDIKRSSDPLNETDQQPDIQTRNVINDITISQQNRSKFNFYLFVFLNDVSLVLSQDYSNI